MFIVLASISYSMGVDHRVQPFDPLDEQPALAAQMPHGVGARIVHDGRDLFQGKTELPVEQDTLQPFEVRLLVDAVSRIAASAGRKKPDLVVVVQRPDRHTGEGCHPPDRVASCCGCRVTHGSPPLRPEV
jgi:hypothetical protein